MKKMTDFSMEELIKFLENFSNRADISQYDSYVLKECADRLKECGKGDCYGRQ